MDYPLLALSDVAGKTRTMEAEFLNAAGNHVTEAFKRYLRPLLGAGMLQVQRLRAPKVARVLKP